ncbi:bifunctional DNA primase/polymerase [Haloechinothrix halophila]|uniref:bifunctional DNA primase/polymerase n=1 Tax=Haloechinothrix halophila TaxID=1069073 RepID=UPI000426DE38|nr:bifunctional DNA primase/polymerase [Haloechinothrix halophila]
MNNPTIGIDSVSWRDAFRVELRAEAIGLATRGWPVVPGTSPVDNDRSGPVPVHDDWQERAAAGSRNIVEWWGGEAHSILVATGTYVDAVEVDAELGHRAASLLRETGRPAPILAMPTGKWVFLTESGDVLPAELAARPGVVWHGMGSWVPLPPTPYEHGVVHWRVKPEVWEWKLPRTGALHGVLARALATLHEPRDRELHARAA